MITGFRTGWANARGDKLYFRRQQLSQRGDFLGGTHKPLEPGGNGELGKMLHLFAGGFLDAQFGEVAFVHAGEDGNAKDERSVFAGSFFCGAEHGGAAAGVDGEHLDIEPSGGGDGFGDGVGDVVKFEVEKDAGAEVANAADDEVVNEPESGSCAAKLKSFLDRKKA